MIYGELNGSSLLTATIGVLGADPSSHCLFLDIAGDATVGAAPERVEYMIYGPVRIDWTTRPVELLNDRTSKLLARVGERYQMGGAISDDVHGLPGCPTKSKGVYVGQADEVRKYTDP